MKTFIVFATLLLAASCSPYGAISTQYHTQDHAGSYSYGYADPNSQKHEVRTHDGTTQGAYSYVDGHGHVQSVSYVADPHSGFHATGTNIPHGPSPLYASVAPLAYAAYAPLAHHVPLTPHGVPVDTPEVQHAKAAHFAAHAAARSGHHHLYKRSLWGGGYAAHHVPVIHNGVPVDTPEVQHAKAAHFAAHAKAAAHAGPAYGHDGGAYAHGAGAYHGAAYHGPIHIPVIHNGVPVDTPAVQHARASHLAALSEASSRAGHGGDGGYYGGSAGHYGGGQYAPAHHGAIHIPVIHNGVPVDTPEVQHAKAAHLAALAEAGSRSYDHGHYDDGSYHDSHHGW